MDNIRREDLSTIFGRFVGVTVPVDSQPLETISGVQNFSQIQDPNLPALKEIAELAEKYGLKTEIAVDKLSTMPLRNDTLRVHVDYKVGTGEWAISRFDLI